jgi:menaquinone-specific isochorismate synthase
MEPHDRGLFSGMIGWFNFNNEGEFAVAIRSALLRKKSIHAFAGCGIVKGSDPEAEYSESELKLKPIISLFESTN